MEQFPVKTRSGKTVMATVEICTPEDLANMRQTMVSRKGTDMDMIWQLTDHEEHERLGVIVDDCEFCLGG